MTVTVAHAQTAETYGEFTARESRTVAEYERATAAIPDTFDVVDSATYGAHGLQHALDTCRADRRCLAEWAEHLAVLRDELHLTNDGLQTQPSKAAALFLSVQTEAYETKKPEVERAILDYLLGAVEL